MISWLCALFNFQCCLFEYSFFFSWCFFFFWRTVYFISPFKTQALHFVLFFVCFLFHSFLLLFSFLLFSLDLFCCSFSGFKSRQCGSLTLKSFLFSYKCSWGNTFPSENDFHCIQQLSLSVSSRCFVISVSALLTHPKQSSILLQ